MNFALEIAVVAVFLFLGMLLFLEMGRRIGIHHIAKDPEGSNGGLSPVEGAVFALLGLLIAFTFSGAASKWDARRHLIAEETNAIGTAFLRLDLLTDVNREQLREDFRRYVEVRLEAYRKHQDSEAANQQWARAAEMQGEIWKKAVRACGEGGSQSATMLLLPAVNQMIDITSTRLMSMRMHPPSIIFVMLTILALVSALIAGYGMSNRKTRSWVHIIGFAAITAVTMYVILDLEYPRLGLLRLDSDDKMMVDLFQSMK